MSAAEIVQVVLAALMVLNLVLLGIGLMAAARALRNLTARIESSVKDLQEEVTVALQQAHDTLVRVEALTRSTDDLVRQEVAPTLQAARATLCHVESATHAVSDGVQNVRRVVADVSLMTGPGAVTAMAIRAFRSSGSKIGLLTVGVGAALRALLKDRPKQHLPLERRKSDGAS